MEIFQFISHLNWFAIFIAAIVAFVAGSIWYSPLLFSKSWQKEVGLSSDDIKNANMGIIFSMSFILSLIISVLLALFIGPESTAINGMITGLLVSIGFVATSLGVNYLFARRSLKLFLIDAGYFVLFFMLIGLILGAWS